MMTSDRRLAYRMLRTAYTMADQRAVETGTPFAISQSDWDAELAKHADELDEARLPRIISLMPWAQERLRRKLLKSAVQS